MTTQQINGVSVATQANVYFDGKCVSHGITFPDGTKKSVGVVLPATLCFGTNTAEVMEWRAGRRQKQKPAILGQVGTGSLLQPNPKKKGPTGPFTAMA